MQARLLPAVLAALLARPVAACEAPAAGSPLDGLCAVVSGKCRRPPVIGVLSAFPYEQRALRAAATITGQVQVDGRLFLTGQLAGQWVVMALTGIGLVNATQTTQVMLEHFDVSAIVFSGVAGSVESRIGDVLVPESWTYGGSAGGAFAADPAFLERARAIAATAPTLERCTPVPLDPPGPETCVEHAPSVTVGGVGASSDPYDGNAFACVPGGNDVFGCDEGITAGALSVVGGGVAAAGGPTTVSIDMESTAVAEVAAGAGVPFVVVRGISDGAGDPLHLTQPFAQFFVYYRVAADNAAVVAEALIQGVPLPTQPRRRARIAADCAFEWSTGVDCVSRSASRPVKKLVSRGCALRARAAEGGVGNPDRLVRKAAARWRRAAGKVERSRLASCCAGGLAARLRAAAELPLD